MLELDIMPWKQLQGLTCSSWYDDFAPPCQPGIPHLLLCLATPAHSIANLCFTVTSRLICISSKAHSCKNIGLLSRAGSYASASKHTAALTLLHYCEQACKHQQQSSKQHLSLPTCCQQAGQQEMGSKSKAYSS